MELKIIKDKLQNISFERSVKENIEDWGKNFGRSKDDEKKNQLWFDTLIRSFLKILEDIEDEEELRVILFSKYIELKCFWKQLNTQIQYQNFKTGSADPQSMIQASLITYILIAIEPIIHEKDLEEIQQFLTKPIREILIEEPNEISTSNESEFITEQLNLQISSLYYDKEKLFQTLGTCEPKEIISMIINMREQVTDLKSEMQDSCLLDGSIQFTGKRKVRVIKA
ncbi:hypothetical protein ND861_14185 [Leptospira sp. 2 VSF19]|uniref:Uncharacterized protein n=1 Tax=Leptospira soteropolitanensis TaxID=2950025 RepID=A0AAW5VM30_9LEPT|nr:hypothetical protein [Leptospira soteropolitanensis]MCW7493794.1 hypothetical protein [Leptospira soteropolitanensis]MCW7501391.1 hypothetical protein [Leptospira soteropolitanensis]MCW7523423.1 hypothetical protein [Leptospira soteropolitanensis]MCW7527505.1 hypothetical protein [Leptospira soteropolitanensis]MCW7531361.1 hypothetical protein [Leptospira soteropolitanensis]